MTEQFDSAFDPSVFLDATITAPTIRRPPLTPGVYNSIIADVKPRKWQSKDGTKAGWVLDVIHEIEVPADQASRVGQTAIKLTNNGFLDLLPDGRGLDNAPGKNRLTRNYRDALDMNKPGDSFSFRMMIGRPCKVMVKNEVYQGDIVDNIDAVAKP